MSSSHQSAGAPGVPRCSEATTGPKTRAKGAQRACRIVRKAHCSGLSFWTVSETASGRYLAENAFDVPAQDYGAGYLTGLEKAGEFFEVLARPGGLGSLSVADILAEVFLARDESQQCASRRGAAAGFVYALTTALQVSAPHLNMRQWTQQSVAYSRALEAEVLSERAERAQAFAARMQAAKAAKRAQAQRSAP